MENTNINSFLTFFLRGACSAALVKFSYAPPTLQSFLREHDLILHLRVGRGLSRTLKVLLDVPSLKNLSLMITLFLRKVVFSFIGN